MREILRLLLLVIVVLPLTLILAGPLLVVAAVRGSQAIGPIVLNPGHSKPSGRVAAFLLGVAIWLAVWGGTGLLLARYVPLLPVAAVPVTATSFPPVPSPTLGVSPAAAEAARYHRAGLTHSPALTFTAIEPGHFGAGCPG